MPSENINNLFFFEYCSSHWYMVPLSLKDKWDELKSEKDGQDKIESVFKHFKCPSI